MRKTSYAVTAAAVIFTTVISILCLLRHDWLVVRYDTPVNAHYEGKYGLTEVCERLSIRLPGGSQQYEDFKCRKFPTRDNDRCNDDNRMFCTEWARQVLLPDILDNAGYAVEIAIGFGALSLVTIILGVSTRSRRRSLWRAVAGLVMRGSVSKFYSRFIAALTVGRIPGPAFILNAVCWVIGILTAVGVITTGISADQGKKWAAGNRAYRPILG
ncbi:hypothetical protein C8J57DRAFT_1049162 [Mycena rebaudengoi]|nr:hypothetical protein C8J57DRAFT_1049162 [Mycena rebaudengoi]